MAEGDPDNEGGDGKASGEEAPPPSVRHVTPPPLPPKIPSVPPPAPEAAPPPAALVPPMAPGSKPLTWLLWLVLVFIVLAGLTLLLLRR